MIATTCIPDLSQAAAAERATILETDTLGHFWRKEPLKLWNKRREILFLALQKRAEESPDLVEKAANTLDELELVLKKTESELAREKAALPEGELMTSVDELINWHSFLANASRVLWLAHHTPEQWDALRATPAEWLLMIERWADEFIGTDEIIAAVKLAHRLRTEHQKFMTLPRPEKKNAGIDAGN